MTSIKAQLLAAIETDPDPILEQTLDYLEYLKTREQKSPRQASVLCFFC